MGKTYRNQESDLIKKEKIKKQVVINIYCLDCKEIFNDCPEDHLCPNCGSWLMETEDILN